MGILKASDALRVYPYRYEDFTYTPYKAFLEDKERVVLLGRLAREPKLSRYNRKSLVSFSFICEDGRFYEVRAWNQPYLAKSLRAWGSRLITLAGIYDESHHSLTLTRLFQGEIAPSLALRPLYRLPNEISQKTFYGILRKGMEDMGEEGKEIIPSSFRRKYRLLLRPEALLGIHFPRDKKDIESAKRTLKYEEALLFEMEMAMMAMGQRKQSGRERKLDRLALKQQIAKLPYELSGDQKKALGEIVADLDSDRSMYRLLQGDVGTGKTLVAALSMYGEITRGRQSALLAPTEALARQHYSVITELFPDLKGKICLLIGGTPGPERREVLEGLRSGRYMIAIGTHALFSKDVAYKELGLAVIDEQHKFGVEQRRALTEKGHNVDLLLMSATPIPRTLALTIYGELDISTLYEFPGGKRDVKTVIASPLMITVYKDVEDALARKERVYVVAPEIEEGGRKASSSVLAVYKVFDKMFPGKVALMHGRLSAEEKESAMLAFKLGVSPILVSTSLIEVGIDVREATRMLVYDPTHFSLAGLHQLRGRIGRDGRPAVFYLLYKGNDEADLKKLNVLVEKDDGFEIAEADLKLRGPGEIAGTAQSGLPEFSLCSIVDDYKIFAPARKDAEEILMHIDEPEFAKIYEAVKKKDQASFRV